MQPQSKQNDMSICAINSISKRKVVFGTFCQEFKKGRMLFCHNAVRFYLATQNQRHDGKYCTDSCRRRNRSWWKILKGENLPVAVALAGTAHFRPRMRSMTHLHLQAETGLWRLTLCEASYWLLNVHYLVSFLKQVCMVYIINPSSQMTEPQETVLKISRVEWPRTARLEKSVVKYLLFCA